MPISRRITAGAALVCALLAAAQAAELPRRAPDFTINLMGGKTLLLSQYKGHPVVLAFILTYCSHCQKTVGYLTKVQNEYGPRGLHVLAAAIETNAQLAMPNFLRNFPTPFPVGYGAPDSALGFMQHPAAKIPMMPMLAFVDPQGNIRAQYEGDDPFFNEQAEQNLRKEVDALFKGAAPAKKSGAK
jgi:thiol-disulfide isomerase/thioredoxin